MAKHIRLPTVYNIISVKDISLNILGSLWVGPFFLGYTALYFGMASQHSLHRYALRWGCSDI